MEGPGFEESAAERGLELMDLLAERGLADIGRAGRGSDPAQSARESSIADLAQRYGRPFDRRLHFPEGSPQMPRKQRRHAA